MREMSLKEKETLQLTDEDLRAILNRAKSALIEGETSGSINESYKNFPLKPA